MASGEGNHGNSVDETYTTDDESTHPSTQTPQERVRLSCLRVLHQLAASTTCAEAMAATSVGTPQVWMELLLHFCIFFLNYVDKLYGDTT